MFHYICFFPNTEEDGTVQVHSHTREYLLHILIQSLEQPAPNLAHLLLGFELRKPVNKTNLQDPGQNAKNCPTLDL